MNRKEDIAMAERYEREAVENEKKAGEVEKSIARFGKEDQQLSKIYVDAIMNAARMAQRLAELYRSRIQQD
jgi:hypothetical protein